MKAVIYAHSTELQSDASIEDQIRICRKRINRVGWTYFSAYADRALSGASGLRAEYQRLLEDAQRRQFDVVREQLRLRRCARQESRRFLCGEGWRIVSI